MGECIVIHFQYKKWFIIDSCLCPKTRNPIAIEYLESIGVNIKEEVKGILITHWHSDHIKGVAQLFKSCPEAKLYLSSALLSEEILTLAALYHEKKFTTSETGIKELSDIVKYVKDNNLKNRISTVKNCYSFFDYRDDYNARLLALSPSDVAVTQSIAKITTLQPKPDSPRLQFIAKENENLNAVAVHFTFGKFSAVLGSDLVEIKNNNTGWSAVFDNDIVNKQSLQTASLFKVSHHGSSTGFHQDIWDKLLVNKPVSITTPFTRSQIPKDNEISTIKDRSSIFLITQNPKSNKKIKYGNMADRELRYMTTNRKTINYKMGHIQIRVSESGNNDICTNENVVKFKN